VIESTPHNKSAIDAESVPELFNMMTKQLTRCGPSLSKAFFTADWLGTQQWVSSVAATQSLVMKSVRSVSRGAHNSLLAPIAGLLLASAGVIVGALQSPAQAIGPYQFEFKADGEDVDFTIQLEQFVQIDPTTNFSGYLITSISGTDGGDPIIALLNPGTNLMPAIVDGNSTFGTDNLFNPLPDINFMPAPGQFSTGGFGGGFAYKVDEGGGVFEDYQFYYGLRPGSTVAGYQGCVVVHGQSGGCGSVIISDLKTTEVPGPLPILGTAAAFGYSRKLRKSIKASKPELISTSAL
jgi:hypothetical protein